MARGKKHTPEQIVSLLRQVEVGVANGKTTAQASKEALITEQTYNRWRKEYGGLQVDQARRLKELEQENAKLKRLVCSTPSTDSTPTCAKLCRDSMITASSRRTPSFASIHRRHALMALRIRVGRVAKLCS